MTSPARAGSTLLAANPTAVARNALPKLVVPSGSSRYCQRSARIARFTNIVASDSASHSGRARTISRDHAAQIDVVQEQREQGDGERQHDDGAEMRSHECERLYYTALAASRAAAATCCCCQRRALPCKMPGFSARGILLPLAAPILQTTLADRAPDRQGKVRDIYDFGDRLLIVATDRISAFDYVLGSGIPDKGKVLTQISAFWFERTRSIVANHVLSTDPATFPARRARAATLLRGRSMLVATDRAAADRMRGARLPVGIGLEGLPGDRRGLRHPAAGRPARVGSAAGADLHAGHQGAERPRHQHQRSATPRELVGARRARRASAT